MVPIVWIGALLVICGLLYMARKAIFRDNMSDSRPSPNDTATPTLEPHHRGLRFLGLSENWPGFALMGIGALLLLLGAAA